ncbi:(2Fe-2S) ferredoxin domain-containing protein [Cyclobacterium jeungdonense]|uniref:(2Fe-2S) ferredoxin domain-containing protein n=1 Tax=Cyclobacterium jeungdonense TaxID=708087 RepID=A0ABT8CCC3_9BACT|nr:(2Fe-2S) ferredoxin domain-containing protein [Cyclobacterium jeungdonense]MDN3689326.1 (2Fe-2S) ferredoxin domain-containing protein [Cyclobacterium jeungdonense]
MKKRRKFIFVCLGSDCKSNGAKTFVEAIKETINEKHFRGKFKLVKTKCMDCCKSGPVVVVNDHLVKNGDLNQLVKELEME